MSETWIYWKAVYSSRFLSISYFNPFELRIDCLPLHRLFVRMNSVIKNKVHKSTIFPLLPDWNFAHYSLSEPLLISISDLYLQMILRYDCDLSQKPFTWIIQHSSTRFWWSFNFCSQLKHFLLKRVYSPLITEYYSDVADGKRFLLFPEFYINNLILIYLKLCI
jgi:hypothetical protein